MRKISVSFNGKIIGTRSTDRAYTHALVLHNFDPDMVRRLSDSAWRNDYADSARRYHRHAAEAALPSYKYASVVSAKELAEYQRVAAMPLDIYVAEQHMQHLANVEKRIASTISRGASVLSYHGSYALAVKAKGSADKVQREFDVLIAEVTQP